MIQDEKKHTTASQPGRVIKFQNKFGMNPWEVMSKKFLGVLCAMVLAGMLVAGLWPFHSPKNQVTWLPAGNGLRIGRHGTILSSGNFQATGRNENAPCSIEVWLVPNSTTGSGTLLAFYAPGKPRQFSLNQSISDLEVQIDTKERWYRTRINRFYLGDIFRGGKPLFITITANGGQTSVYLDGALVETATKFPLSGKELDGELVVATWPTNDNSWSGLLRGLAIYEQELSPSQVAHHYKTWTEEGRPEVSENERAIALYLFNEHAGRVIHNQGLAGTDLSIPERYQIVNQAFLKPFWEEFDPGWHYWEDLLINIAGFVPFGFLFCAYLSLARRIKRPALVTILLGFAVSLTIECLQSFLPTRDSGTTDLITNTLGTSLGVWLYRSGLWRGLLARI